LVYGEFLPTLGGALGGAAVLSGLFYALFTLSKGKWIGFGDVKLAVALGLLAGGVLEATLLLFAASVLGMLVSLPLLLSGKANRKSLVPFGPFLLAGMVVTQLFGSDIIVWYTDLLLLG
jgi:leader peptidase (prepilin peptidase)/N-methyltransferase